MTSRSEVLCYSVLLLFLRQIGQADGVTIGFLVENSLPDDFINIINATVRSIAEQIIPNMPQVEILITKFEPLVPNATISKTVVQHACDMLANGVVAVVGPLESTSVIAVSWLFDQLNVPLLTPTATSPLLQKQRHSYVFRLAASDNLQSKSLSSILSYFSWKHITLVSSKDVYGIYGILSLQHVAAQQNWRVSAVHTLHGHGDDLISNIRTVLQLIYETGVRITVLNMSPELVALVLKQAKFTNMTGEGWVWILTDEATSSIEPLQGNSGAKLPISDDYLGLIGITYGSAQTNGDITYSPLSVNDSAQANAITRETIDAFTTILYGLRDFLTKQNRLPNQLSLNCLTSAPWPDGSQLAQTLKQMNESGLAGPIQFDSSNGPANYVYDIVNMRSDGWRKVATYSEARGFQMELQQRFLLPGISAPLTAPDFVSPMKGAHLQVVTIQEQPFVLYTAGRPRNMYDIQANETEGYVIDLLEKLSEVLGFTYTLYASPDDSFGSLQTNSHIWNGMARELVEKRADIAAASFTVNAVRETDFDFTAPYLDLGQRVIMKKKSTQVDIFRFIAPFSGDVWRDMLLCFLFVGLAVGCLEKLSPYGVHGEFVHTYHDMELENSTRRRRKRFAYEKKIAFEFLSLPNAIWFSWASLLTQGYEVHPRGVSGRTIAVAWWLGVVIFVATYTAKLGSYLISDRLIGDINSLQDLLAQDKVQWGTVLNSAPQTFFCDSKVDDYQKVCRKSILVNTSDQGFEMARTSDGLYAFIWDSAVIDSVVESTPCDLKAVGSLFGRIGYGLGVQKNSPYLEVLSQQILALRSQGFMEDLFNKWYIEKSQCRANEEASSTNDPVASLKYGVRHMIGVFLVIYSSLGMCVVILIIEWLASAAKAVEPQYPHKPKTFMEALWYRWDRLKRDFFVNYVPDDAKNRLGMHEYMRHLQPALREQLIKNMHANGDSRQHLAVMNQQLKQLAQQFHQDMSLKRVLSVQSDSAPLAPEYGMYTNYVDTISSLY